MKQLKVKLSKITAILMAFMVFFSYSGCNSFAATGEDFSNKQGAIDYLVSQGVSAEDAETLADQYFNPETGEMNYDALIETIMTSEATIADIGDGTEHVVLTQEDFSTSETFVMQNLHTYEVDTDITVSGMNQGLSAMKVEAGARVFLEIKDGCTLNVHGGNHGGAGIEVPEKSMLVIKGSGTLEATGGAGTFGEDGSDGRAAMLSTTYGGGEGAASAGDGGNGGNGGFGSGAGIGGRGGDDSQGGLGGAFVTDMWVTDFSRYCSRCTWDYFDRSGGNGQNGQDGHNGGNCGTIVILGGVTVDATSGGKLGRTVHNGNEGASANDSGSGWKNYYASGGGGGGGAGEDGKDADYGIGGGGAGGAAGGGGGAGGNNVSSGKWRYAIGGCGGSFNRTASCGRKDGSTTPGRGGNAGKCGYNGKSGRVYIDQDATVSGRPCYYFEGHFYQQGADVVTSTTMLLQAGDLDDNHNTDYSALGNLAIALEEVFNQNALGSYTVEPGPEGFQTSSFCNGCYRVSTSGTDHDNWYKDIVDTSDGYIYNFSDLFAEAIKPYLDAAYGEDEDNSLRDPYRLVEDFWGKLSRYSATRNIDSSALQMMHDIFYWEPYGEPFGGYSEDRERTAPGICHKNGTDSRHYSISCLQRMNYIYTTVSEANSPRSVTWYYDNERKCSVHGVTGYWWYRFSSKMTIYHGKKGIAPNNWLSYMGDDMPISQLNIPGTHDSGTFNLKFIGGEILKCQDLSIAEQLGLGCRLFDCRLVFDEDKYDDGMSTTEVLKAFYLAHGPATCYKKDGSKLTLYDVMNDCWGYLAENEKEFVILMHNSEGDESANYRKALGRILHEAEEGTLDDTTVVYPYHKKVQMLPESPWAATEEVDGDIVNVFTYCDEDGNPVSAEDRVATCPTVSDMRGKIVFIDAHDINKTEDHDNCSADNKIDILRDVLDNCETQQVTSGIIPWSTDGSNPQPRVIFTSCFDGKRLLGSGIAIGVANLALFPFLPETILAVYLKGLPGSPQYVAPDVNQFIKDYDFEEGTYYGWMLHNFPSAYMIQRYYVTNVEDWASIFSKHLDGESRIIDAAPILDHTKSYTLETAQKPDYIIVYNQANGDVLMYFEEGTSGADYTYTYNPVNGRVTIFVPKAVAFSDIMPMNDVSDEAEEISVVSDYNVGDTTTKIVTQGIAQSSGLDALAIEKKSENTTENVKVVLSAESKNENEIPAEELNAIKETAVETAGKGNQMAFVSIDLTLTVGTTDSAITDTGDNVIEIKVPFSSASNIVKGVCRYHDGDTTALIGDSLKTGAVDTYYHEDGVLHVFASKFSTYAISYAKKTGGGGGHKTTDAGIVVTESAVSEGGLGFIDVSEKDYFYDAVKWANEKNITAGIDENHFAPFAITNRAQMITFLWRAKGCPVVNYAMDFRDVPQDMWYTEAVRWAVSEGITKGTDEMNFSPDAPVTRAQAVTFLARAEGADAGLNSTSTQFKDVNPEAFYSDAVAWAFEKGITSGTSDTTFSPDDECLRGQIVTFLYRNFN